MTRRAPTRRRPTPDAPDPAARYVRGPEPGDRTALVEALAELLIGIAEREAGGQAAAAPREVKA